MFESAFSNAIKRWSVAVSGVTGLSLMAVFTAVAAVIGSQLFGGDIGTLEVALQSAIFAFAVGVVAPCALLFLFFWCVAPLRQRDEARARLLAIRELARASRVEFESAFAVNGESASEVELRLRVSSSHAGSFVPYLNAVNGTAAGSRLDGSPLWFVGKEDGNVAAGEIRLLTLGFLRLSHDGLTYRPPGAAAEYAVAERLLLEPVLASTGGVVGRTSGCHIGVRWHGGNPAKFPEALSIRLDGQTAWFVPVQMHGLLND